MLLCLKQGEGGVPQVPNLEPNKPIGDQTVQKFTRDFDGDDDNGNCITEKDPEGGEDAVLVLSASPPSSPSDVGGAIYMGSCKLNAWGSGGKESPDDPVVHRNKSGAEDQKRVHRNQIDTEGKELRKVYSRGSSIAGRLGRPNSGGSSLISTDLETDYAIAESLMSLLVVKSLCLEYMVQANPVE